MGDENPTIPSWLTRAWPMLVALVMVAGGWATMQSRIDALAERATKSELKIVTLDATAAATSERSLKLESRIIALEVTVSTQVTENRVLLDHFGKSLLVLQIDSTHNFALLCQKLKIDGCK